MGSAALRVILADDHPIYLDGLAQAFSRAPGIEVTASCVDGREALAKIREIAPDVAVLDMRMSGLQASQVIERLRLEQIATRILILSAYADGDLIVAAFEAGASGYLTKDTDRDQICQAVRRVATGGVVMSADVQEVLAAHLRATATRARSHITDREHQALALLAEGLSVSEIADRLILSPATVKTHLHHLYEKLGVCDRTAAVAEAMRRGLLR